MSRSPHAAGGLGIGIREARNKHGLTQTQLALKAGVSRPSVARVESGTPISIVTLAKVASALGLEIEVRYPDETRT